MIAEEAGSTWFPLEGQDLIVHLQEFFSQPGSCREHPHTCGDQRLDCVGGLLPRYLRAESVVLGSEEATVGLDRHGKIKCF